MGLLKKIGGFLGGGGGALLGFAGDLFGNSAASAEAQANREWQERMAKNAVQYRVKDLEKAGINPMLAAGMGLGGGLSAPSGAVAQQNIGIGSRAVASAASLRLVQKQEALLDSEADLNRAKAQAERASAGQAGSQEWLNKEVLPQYYTAQGTAAISSAYQSNAQRRYLEESLPLLVAQVKEIAAATSLKEAEAVAAKARALLDNADEAQKRALLPFLKDLAESDALRAKLGLPEAKNKSEVELSWWGGVRHYLPDIRQLVPFTNAR